MTKPFDVNRFRALVAADGTRTELWPEGERDAALALVSASDEARALFEEERALDRALGGAGDVQLAPALLRRLNEVPVRFPRAERRPSRWAGALAALGWAAAAAFGVYWGAHTTELESATPAEAAAGAAAADPAVESEIESIELALGTIDDLGGDL
jgi:hypothetical protein